MRRQSTAAGTVTAWPPAAPARGWQHLSLGVSRPARHLTEMALVMSNGHRDLGSRKHVAVLHSGGLHKSRTFDGGQHRHRVPVACPCLRSTGLPRSTAVTKLPEHSGLTPRQGVRRGVWKWKEDSIGEPRGGVPWYCCHARNFFPSVCGYRNCPCSSRKALEERIPGKT